MTDKDKQPKPMSEIIARMFQIRAERAEISKKDSELVQENDELEAALMGRLDSEGLEKSTAKGHGTASIGEVILPQVDDWDLFQAHLKETGDLHLLQRRVAAAAFRELYDSKVPVPGVSAYVKRTINLRST